MEQSFARLRTPRIDLMQVHNLVDWRTQLATLRGWKEAGRVRYLGITHYTPSAYPEVEAVLRAEPLPGWAAEIGCTSWAQVLLKFVLSHPAVTCAIPGTARPEHMRDNVAAGMGAFPDAAFWRRNADALRG